MNWSEICGIFVLFVVLMAIIGVGFSDETVKIIEALRGEYRDDE